MAKIKGTGMLNLLRGLKVQSPEALSDLPAPLRRYLDEKILVASWYPADDFMEILRYLCSILPVDVIRSPNKDPWEWFGRRCAAIDLVEIYSSMLQHGRPWRTLDRFPRLWRLYFDSGFAEVAIAGDTEARVEIRDFPYVEDAAYCRHLAGYLHTTLELAGAEDVRVEVLNEATSTQPARWSLSWQSSSS